MRRLLWLLPLLGGTLSAQDDLIPPRMDYFPYLLGDPNHGVLVIGHWQYARQAEYESRHPHDYYLGIEAAWGSRGSRSLTAKFRAPGLVPEWRFAADVGAVREGRFGYYGLGPEGDAGLDPDAFPTDYFRTRRTQYYGRAEVTRRIAGPLHGAVAAGITGFRFRPVTEESLFQSDHGEEPLEGTDATARLSLIVDTRNNELIPARGVLLEAGVLGGTGRFCPSPCGSGYAGVYGNARGYFSPRRGIVFAGRAAFRTMGNNAPLDSRYEFPGWERDLSAFGGFDSHRGYVRGRLVGSRAVLTSAEVRYDLVDGGDYGALTLLAFVDGGGVYNPDGAGGTTFSGWKTSFGSGFALRILRQAIITLHFARGPDGFNFTSGIGWSF